jgi:hypothetical protein
LISARFEINIDKNSPIIETRIKRKKFCLFNLFEKLQNVFMKYEDIVAVINANAFANIGDKDIDEIKNTAMSV